jgi:DNA-binding MurR/RpiR family transcriptional regulator
MGQAARVDVALRSLLPSLTPAEARVARVFLDAVEAQENPRVAHVAALARTSTATVVRLYQRVGYDRYADFWIDLTLSARGNRPTELPTMAGRLSPGDSLADVVASLRAAETLSLADTADALDLTALARAVEVVRGAARVDLYGMGASAVVSADLQLKLCRIGIAALRTESPHEALTAIAAAPPGTVAIAISHSGETASVVDFARTARSADVPVVALTNVGTSSLAMAADVVLTTAAREVPFRVGALTSRIAQLLVVDSLFIGVALATYDRSMEALRRTYRVIEEAERADTDAANRTRRSRPGSSPRQDVQNSPYGGTTSRAK